MLTNPYVQEVDGEPVLSTAALSLLIGVTPDDIRAEVARQGNPQRFVMPKSWIRQGKANAARLGTDNMAEALARLIAESGSRP